jgi:hypothetical protein
MVIHDVRIGMTYFKVPRMFTRNDKNPFTEDGTYGPGWSGFFVLDRRDGYAFMGTGNAGLFAYEYCRDAGNLSEILADFLRYEDRYERNVILSFPSDIDIDGFVEHALTTTPEPHTIRETDPRYLVHSTSLSAGRRILEEGELKSLARLAADGSEASAPRLGFHTLGEPPDYAEHICLGSFDSVGPERVTAENAAGRFLADPENQIYEPGIRFYFDCHKIIQAGLDVRLVGAIRVHDILPLDPYLLASITLEDVDPNREVKEWTPKIFTVAANELFLHRLNQTTS